jgi:Arc/MetJ-type ribon-helix-helix transcriptional regulator
MSKKEQVDVEEKAPEVTDATADWREAFEHAAKAAREAFTAAAEATTEMLRQGGKLAEQTMSEAQRTVVVTLDEETFKSLDKMVAAGVAKSRAEAVRHLLGLGLKASGDLLSRIDKVEAQIEELRAKMREIPLEGAD